jgi:GTPase SAR1 family protein
MSNSTELQAKVIIVGDSGVGKSSILGRLIDDTFLERQLPTIGVDFRKKYSVLPDKR